MRRRRKRGPGRGRDELRTTSSEAGPGDMCEEDEDEHHDDERELLRRSSLLFPGAEVVFGLGMSCPMPVGRLTVRRATTILKCKVIWLMREGEGAGIGACEEQGKQAQDPSRGLEKRGEDDCGHGFLGLFGQGEVDRSRDKGVV
jgi:hypothetical protein